MVFYFRNLTLGRIEQRFFQKIIHFLLKHYSKLERFEISLVLVDNSKIRSLNKQYRGINQITDVLCFNLGRKLPTLQKTQAKRTPDQMAEIFISLERGQRQAEAMGHSLKTELATLFIHGLLHVLGYDDATAKRRVRMIKAQDKLLRDLKGQRII